jgi:hypothetical protein
VSPQRAHFALIDRKAWKEVLRITSSKRRSLGSPRESSGIHRCLLGWRLIWAGLPNPALYAEGGAPMSLLGIRRIQDCAHA